METLMKQMIKRLFCKHIWRHEHEEVLTKPHIYARDSFDVDLVVDVAIHEKCVKCDKTRIRKSS